MSLVLYNTMTKRKEPLVPVEEGKVKIYVCGPTVYDHCHIGHARAVVVFDVLARHLKTLGLEVVYIRNITDLDDKIINRARSEGLDFLQLAENFINSFHQDMDALGALRPDLEPRATEHIDQMIADIQALIEAGYAYPVDGDVYYEVGRFSPYGRLSGRNLDDMKAGARIEIDERKRNPLDFALWKNSKPGEPRWPSPWGQGRPGWHTECSVMSHRYLGAEFDIHGGGHDLIFPHHENEIAQAAALGRKFAHCWVHNGFVRINHQKMSKSLNNFFTIKEILARFHPEVLRLFLLSKHYRSPIDFSDEALSEAGRSLDRAYRALREAEEFDPGPEPSELPEKAEAINALFREAMNDDLNTAKALGHIFEAVRELHRLMDEAKTDRRHAAEISIRAKTIKDMGVVLGLLNQDPTEYFASRRSLALDQMSLDREKIESLIQARAEARTNRNFAEADRIRDELKAQGIILEDLGGGETKWHIAS